MYKTLLFSGCLLAASLQLGAHPGELGVAGCHQCVGPECEAYGHYSGKWHCHREDTNYYNQHTFERKRNPHNPEAKRIRSEIASELCHAIQSNRLIRVVIGAKSNECFDACNVTDCGAPIFRHARVTMFHNFILQPYAVGLDAEGRGIFAARVIDGFSDFKGQWLTIGFNRLRFIDVMNECADEACEPSCLARFEQILCSPNMPLSSSALPDYMHAKKRVQPDYLYEKARARRRQ